MVFRPVLFHQGSAGPPVFSKKLNCIRHLQPLDTFSRLLVGPKYICGQGSTPNPAGGAYSAPPDLLAGGEGARCPIPQNPSPLSVFGFEYRIFTFRSPPKSHRFREQSKFAEKVKKNSGLGWWDKAILSRGNGTNGTKESPHITRSQSGMLRETLFCITMVWLSKTISHQHSAWSKNSGDLCRFSGGMVRLCSYHNSNFTFWTLHKYKKCRYRIILCTTIPRIISCCRKSDWFITDCQVWLAPRIVVHLSSQPSAVRPASIFSLGNVFCMLQRSSPFTCMRSCVVTLWLVLSYRC